ncbi:EndoU domain-containing protein [Bacillus sp. SL00103]
MYLVKGEKAKRTGSNQSWFPENWTESDIAEAGAKIVKSPHFSKVENGVTIFGEYKGVRVGVIKTNGEVGTIFPDATNSLNMEGTIWILKSIKDSIR